MGESIMSEIIISILNVGQDATYFVASLTIMCALLFMTMTDSKALTVLFTPLAAIGAMTGIYLSRELGLYYSTDEESNVVLSGTLGLMLSLVIIVVTARIGYAITNMVRRRQTDHLRKSHS